MNGPESAHKTAQPAPAALRRSVEIVNDRLESRDLFVGTREIIIVHGEDHYRLRLTAQNKLILTK
ncbi:MAG: hemin uptake protein HemP [Rhizobiales bacterium]|nr:hemin uptake protein HemP [Hyphomicrobiales bacterium]